MGAWVAFEMAHQLRAAGERVALLALISSHFTLGYRRATLLEFMGMRWREFRGLPAAEKVGFLAQRALNVRKVLIGTLRPTWEQLTRRGRAPAAAASAARFTGLEAVNRRAEELHQFRPLECDAVLFKTRLVGRKHPVVHDGWKTLIMGELQTRTIAGRHRQVFDEPFVRTLARELTGYLDQRVPATIVGPHGDILHPSLAPGSTLR